MFKLISIVIILIAFAACMTTTQKYQLNVNCAVATEELFKNLTEQLMFEGLSVTQSNIELGYLRAESAAGYSNMTGSTMKRVWEFHIKNNHITAYAKTVYVAKNRYGSIIRAGEVYYRDNSSKDWTWYWNVRNRLQSFCGNDIKIIQTDVKNIY